MRAATFAGALLVALSAGTACAHPADPAPAPQQAADTGAVTLDSARQAYFDQMQSYRPDSAKPDKAAEAETLLKKLRVSLTGGRIIETLDTIGVYHDLGIEMPRPLLLLETRLAVLGHDWDRATSAIDAYLALPMTARDPQHADALALRQTISRARASYMAKRSAQWLQKARAECGAGFTGQIQPGTTFRDCPFTPQMTVLPGGSFQMGPSVPGRPEDAVATPRHEVAIRPVAIGTFEVTFDEWAACVEGGGCNNYRPVDRWGQRNQPVINVSWDDAQAYIAWLSAATGRHYRLLSEAEWEYAARGGRTTDYATGETITTRDANFQSQEGTVPVGSYAPNGFGLYDMHGNVWEWTQDCWHPDYKGAPTDGSAWMTGDCAVHVFRGGCWYNLPQHLRASVRFPSRQGARNAITGIRVARELDTVSAGSAGPD